MLPVPGVGFFLLFEFVGRYLIIFGGPRFGVPGSLCFVLRWRLWHLLNRVLNVVWYHTDFRWAKCNVVEKDYIFRKFALYLIAGHKIGGIDNGSMPVQCTTRLLRVYPMSFEFQEG